MSSDQAKSFDAAVPSMTRGRTVLLAQTRRRHVSGVHQPRIGQWVEVRSRDDILATLDSRGRLGDMPFMPEMLEFCGRRFQVHKLAHKTCDTIILGRVRSLEHTVHLGTRCDGSAHGGCQAGCQLYWREEWLRALSDDEARGAESAPISDEEEVVALDRTAELDGSDHENVRGCTEATLTSAACTIDPVDGEPVYTCQATRLHDFTKPLNPYHLPTYFRDLTSGNVALRDWVRGVVYINYERLINLGIGLGPALRWLYDAWQRLTGGLPYPRREGRIPKGEPTPSVALDLKEGEWVRVKSYPEILATCTVELRNRGMSFDGEQVPYCGGTYRVHKRVERIIDERTGKMIRMKNPCIILEGVVCKGRYSECRMFCPREIYSYWREIWLERADPPSASTREPIGR